MQISDAHVIRKLPAVGPRIGSRVWGLGFRVWGLGWVGGLGFKVLGLGSRVWFKIFGAGWARKLHGQNK